TGYIDGPPLHIFYKYLVLVPIICEYLQYFLMILGILFILIAVILEIVSRKQQIPAEEITSGTGDENQRTSAGCLLLPELSKNLLPEQA
ncbi:hypothetical protein scyTo_0022200, partial [Scyliorhinus torazame]|nr:hypothetical protein [Scyliorhinus torazame]